jgi:hypothetical protein
MSDEMAAEIEQLHLVNLMWRLTADMLYHAIHCAEDEHRIEAENWYHKLVEKQNAR